MQKYCVVCDFEDGNLLKNRIFDESIANKYPGASVWPKIYCLLKGDNIDCITADIYLDQKPYYKKVLYISDMTTKRTKEILKSNVVPLLISCAESPNVAWKFYHNLKKISSYFKYSLMFKGVENKISPKSSLQILHWPNPNRAIINTKNWESKKFLVMVASNKIQIEVNGKRNLYWLRFLYKNIYLQYLKIVDPLFSFKDLYKKRLDAINYFSHFEGFDLYGTKWNDVDNLDIKTQQSIKILKPRSVNDKISTMSEYKFALCFENCVFPGYITEKIFDCFAAGTIPIYLGAPDISDYIPADTFIDYRKYKNFEVLNKFLINLTEKEIHKYLKAIHSYINSQRYSIFTEELFASKILEIIKSNL